MPIKINKQTNIVNVVKINNVTVDPRADQVVQTPVYLINNESIEIELLTQQKIERNFIEKNGNLSRS